MTSENKRDVGEIERERTTNAMEKLKYKVWESPLDEDQTIKRRKREHRERS